jgi:hypothetical protein
LGSFLHAALKIVQVVVQLLRLPHRPGQLILEPFALCNGLVGPLKKLILLVLYRGTENMWVPIWHDILPLLMQAGARMVSQPTTPTGNALAVMWRY